MLQNETGAPENRPCSLAWFGATYPRNAIDLIALEYLNHDGTEYHNMSYNSRRRKMVSQILLAAILVGVGPTFSAETSPLSASKKKTERTPTHTVTRGSVKGKVQLDAVVEAAEMQPVKIETKAWTDLTVVDAVAHGARVKRGDVLVRIDTEKIRDQIEDLEREQPGAAVTLELTVAELENLKQTTPLKLELAKRVQRNADDDYSYFESTGRAQREKSALFNLKGAEQRLENVMEELKQLEKMYKADDVTEETEEIILKRQRFQVEFAQFGLESAKLGSDRDLKTLIPRENENLKSQKRDQELALASTEQTLPKTLAKKQLDFEKLKRDQRKAEKRLTDLKKDLESLNVRATMDGIVYYGACENGKWTTGASMAKRLIPTGKLSPNETFITIVNPDKLLLRTVIPEAELSKVKQGMKGQASPVSVPDKKLTVKLEELGYIPLPGAGFEAIMSLQQEKGVRLVPGMNCKATFGDVRKANALTAPKEAVFSEDGQSHVFVLKSDGSHEKRTVKTGDSDSKTVEILDGLSEGDKILLKKPEQ